MTAKLIRITLSQIDEIRQQRLHKTRRSGQTGRRIKIGRRMATIVNEFRCLAGRYSGDVHIDGTPIDELRMASWY